MFLFFMKKSQVPPGMVSIPWTMLYNGFCYTWRSWSYEFNDWFETTPLPDYFTVLWSLSTLSYGSNYIGQYLKSSVLEPILIPQYFRRNYAEMRWRDGLRIFFSETFIKSFNAKNNSFTFLWAHIIISIHPKVVAKERIQKQLNYFYKFNSKYISLKADI